MPRGGTSARVARRSVAPWWEELDGEAFRDFPTARASRPDAPMLDASPAKARRAVAGSAPASQASQASQSRPVSQARPGGQARAGSQGRYSSTSTGGGQGIEGRRTVTIRGYGAERNLPMARPTLRRHERPGYRPDRTALWAVLLGVLLIVVASASAHAAVITTLVH